VASGGRDLEMNNDPNGTMTSLLKAEAIRKSHGGVPASHDGRIELRAGSVHALCGGNGAGKSTFLDILLGLESPEGGRIWLNGGEVRFASPALALAAGISVTTPELSFLFDMTVAENLSGKRAASSWVVRRPGRDVPRGGCIAGAASLRGRSHRQDAQPAAWAFVTGGDCQGHRPQQLGSHHGRTVMIVAAALIDKASHAEAA